LLLECTWWDTEGEQVTRALRVNTLLYTRDGRDIGNAIVTGVQRRSRLPWRYQIKTDYGNSSMLCRAEIEVFFYIGGEAERDHKHCQ